MIWISDVVMLVGSLFTNWPWLTAWTVFWLLSGGFQRGHVVPLLIGFLVVAMLVDGACWWFRPSLAGRRMVRQSVYAGAVWANLSLLWGIMLGSLIWVPAVGMDVLAGRTTIVRTVKTLALWKTVRVVAGVLFIIVSGLWSIGLVQ